MKVKNKHKSFSVKKIISHFILIISSLIFIFPFFWMIMTSFKPASEIFQYPPTIFPSKFLWSNYVDTINAIPIIRMFFNSVFVTVTITVGTVFFCALSAYSFARLRFPLRDTLFKLFLATMMVPPMVTTIPMFIIMREFGWIDTYYALIIPFFFGSAFGTFLLRQFFLTVPMELDEAAKMDGASYFTIFFKILIPLMKAPLAALSVFTFMGTWNEFFWPLVMIQTDKLKPLTLGLASFQGLYSTDYHLLMGGAVISVVPVVIAYLFAQKYFIEGIALTGIK